MPPSLSPARTLLLSGIAPWLCVAIGVVFLYRGSQDLTLGKQTAGWARTGGRIVASSVEQAPPTKNGTTYRALFLYEYQVGTTVLHGTRRRLADPPIRSEADARAIVTRYPVGRDVTVFYNPFLPAEAVLELASPWWPYGVLGTGGVFILVGLSLTVLMARRGRTTRPARRPGKGPPA